MPLVLFRLATGTTRRLLTCLLALVVSVQGFAAGVAAVRGSMHTHAGADRSPLLEDFRRHLPERRVQPGGLSSWFGHLHAHASPQRHHHAPAEAGVQRSADDALSDSMHVDGGTSGSTTAAAFLALLPAPCCWQGACISEARPCAPPWAATSGYFDRLERPPRVV